MEPGDLIITPPMRWHDHGHEGTEPVVWLDGLDIPLVRSFEASWASARRPAQPPATPSDSSQDELTAAGLLPRHSRYPDTGYPEVRWPWRRVRAALASLATGAAKETPVILRHVNPRTGSVPLATMGSEAQWLRPGESTRAERRTASGVFHVIEGRGESRIGEATIAWEPGDCFVGPPWHWIEHENRSAAAPACLFHLTDEPALRALEYHTEVGMYTTVFAFFMNKAKYDSLPADVKKVLDETTSPAGGYWRRVGESWDKAEVVGRKATVDRKNEIYTLPKEERKRWRAAVKGIDDKWAADLEAKGLPGKALLKDARALSVKYDEAD